MYFNMGRFQLFRTAQKSAIPSRTRVFWFSSLSVTSWHAFCVLAIEKMVSMFFGGASCRMLVHFWRPEKCPKKVNLQMLAFVSWQQIRSGKCRSKLARKQIRSRKTSVFQQTLYFLDPIGFGANLRVQTAYFGACANHGHTVKEKLFGAF